MVYCEDFGSFRHCSFVRPVEQSGKEQEDQNGLKQFLKEHFLSKGAMKESLTACACQQPKKDCCSWKCAHFKVQGPIHKLCCLSRGGGRGQPQRRFTTQSLFNKKDNKGGMGSKIANFETTQFMDGPNMEVIRILL